MMNNKEYLESIYKKESEIEYDKISKNVKNSFYTTNFKRLEVKNVLQIALTFIISIGVTIGVVYAGIVTYQNIWQKPKEYKFEDTYTVTKEDEEKSISKEEAEKIANQIVKDIGKEPGNITKCDLIKTSNKTTWEIAMSNKISLSIDSKTGKLKQLSDFSIDDTKIPSTLSKEQAEEVAKEIYTSLGYKQGEYELAEIKKNAITDEGSLWQVDFCKKYGDIYNYYQDIRISFIPEIKQIVILTIFDYDYEDNQIVITRNEAIEIAKEKAISLGRSENEIKTIEAKLDIRLMNPNVFMQEQMAIPKTEDEINNIQENNIENENTQNLTQDVTIDNSRVVYETEEIVRKVWVVEIDYTNTMFTDKEAYFVDCTTGEIIGGDQVK